MRVRKGVVYSDIVGSFKELLQVERILTLDSDAPSLIRYGEHSDSKARCEVYTGLLPFIEKRLPSGLTLDVVEDLTEIITPSILEVDIPDDYIPFDDPDHRLRDYQIKAAKKAICAGRGALELPTGSGKTEIAAVIIKFLLDNGYVEKVYVVAETRFLMNQLYDRLQRRGIEDVQRMGGGRKFQSAQVQVCVINSLSSALRKCREDVVADFAQCDLIMFDEVHHLQAKSWVFVGEVCPAPYRFGLTATLWSNPFEYSQSDLYLLGLTGDLVVQVPSSVLRKRGYLAEPYVTFIRVRGPAVEGRDWKKCYDSGIVQHEVRNSYVVSLAYSLFESFYKTLVFSTRINHCMRLVRILTELGADALFVKGGESVARWKPSGRWDFNKWSIDRLAEEVSYSDRLIVVSTSVLDEGVDIPSFNALIMAGAMKKYRRTVQRVGRGMRPKLDDNSVYVFDFYDETHDYLVKHSIYRYDTYELEGYTFMETLDEASERMKAALVLDDSVYTWKDERRKAKRGLRS